MSAPKISAAISLDNSALIEYRIPERSRSPSARPGSLEAKQMGALAGCGYLQQRRDQQQDPLESCACFWSNAATVQVLFIFILQLYFLKLSCWNTLGFPGDPPAARWHQLTGQAELQHSPGLYSAQLPTCPWGPLLPRGPRAPRVPAFLMSARHSGLSAGPEELQNSWNR